MFTQPVSPPPPGPSPSTSAPSRPSRLRGLSYLRNYTQNHLLSREGHHSGSGTANSSNGGSGTTSPNRPQGGSGSALTRSLSYSPTTTGPPANNRLTLISSTPDTGRNTGRNHASTTPPPAVAPALTPTSVHSIEGQEQTATTAATTENTSTTTAPPATSESSQEQSSTMGRARSSTNSDGAANPESLPSIRFSAYYDPRSTRPSLTFPPITRTLPSGSEKIRVGRYSERDSHSMSNAPGNQPSAAPVGFKSKVVSRRHCEFWYEDGKWYIKDVKSSSGTFLNHIRLSPPSQESKAFPVNDGDIVQLGIDFKGGEEMIFRCVKMRLELNRGWQTKLNTFK